MQIDTTIPGTSAEIVAPDVARPTGTAGRIAIVGIFERGDEDTPYFFNNPRDALRTLGDSEDYSGSKIIEMVFKQDQDQNNYGATSIICVNAGATAKASYQLVDTTSPTPLNVMLLTAKYGKTWANGATGGLTVSIANGTISGKKFTLKLNDTVVESWDNVSNTELYNKINGYSSYITATATAEELARTLANITDQNFAGGTETESPTTGDISNSLDAILQENFDILIYTDTPDDTFYAITETYLNSKLAVDKPAMAIMPIATTKTVSQTLTLMAGADSALLMFTHQTFTIAGEILNDAESCARYAGFVAGMPVSESTTNKIINDIDDIDTEFSTANIYDLTNGGGTVFTLKNREKNRFGVVSMVTGSQAVDDNGRKTAESEGYAMRTLTFVLNYFNMSDWLGRTGVSKTVPSLEGELNNRRSKLLKAGLAEDINIVVRIDEENDQLSYADISVQPLRILKWLHNRIKLMEA